MHLSIARSPREQRGIKRDHINVQIHKDGQTETKQKKAGESTTGSAFLVDRALTTGSDRFPGVQRPRHFVLASIQHRLGADPSVRYEGAGMEADNAQ